MSIRLFASLLAIGLQLCRPGSAAAQSVTLGSPLTAEPNISVDCAQQPAIADVNGNYGIFASGVADCTWRQSGVFGVVSGDTRFSSVPGDGRIVSVSVRSGPTPAPLRFVIFRQLQSPGGGGIQQCCFYVSETNTVQPQPNTVSTFTTDIPVQRNTIDGVQAVDLIGISAAAGTGSLPLHPTGQNNAFQLTQFGSVNAGFFYPRMGAIPNDSGGGRREDGIPGVEVLIQWTWCPASAGPQGCRTGGGGGGGGIPTVRNQTAPVANGKAPIDLVCNGDAVCKGLLEILGGRASVRAGGSGARYGKRKFKIAAGGTAVVPIKLSGKAKRLLKQTGSVPVTLRLTPKGGTALTFDLTLTL